MSDDVVLRDTKGVGEYPQLVKVWRTAVDATHGFLAAEHRAAIEARLATDYLPQVSITVAERRGTPIGFAGTADGKLEMLFVDADHRGGGIGTKLLQHVLVADGATAVDVNDQNEQAVGFYQRAGFEVTGRSPVDGDGLPYPLLHMVLATTADHE
ncbi:putative acetyltransferase [Prauserella sediminis]|uniref:Putative acetyltransferase n=1 Tax=Prauserella sediminis TaxID=577680 RepID=A0A839XVH9_9PSEU|nr:acetyltransferase [Prauserella sediminis]MBB3663815.1 putative acetyltransferase [Prauserella sediminis]